MIADVLKVATLSTGTALGLAAFLGAILAERAKLASRAYHVDPDTETHARATRAAIQAARVGKACVTLAIAFLFLFAVYLSARPA